MCEMQPLRRAARSLAMREHARVPSVYHNFVWEIKNTHHLGRVRAHTCVFVHSLTSRDYRPIGTTATAQKWCCRKCSARVKYAVLIEFQRLRVCGYRYRRAPAAGQQINLNVIKNVVQFAFNVWFLRTLSNRHHRFANKMHTQTRLTDE